MKNPLNWKLFVTIFGWAIAALVLFTLLGWIWGEGELWSWERAVSIWRIGQNVGDPLERVRIALTMIGGIGAVAYLVIKYRERSSAEREEERADRREAEERLAKAVEQLGSESPQVRIAAVYAATNVADTYLGDYKQRVVDILCGYLRTQRGKWVEGEDGKEQYESQDGAVESTILKVLRSHYLQNCGDSGQRSPSWSHCGLSLEGAIFSETLDLSNCVFQAEVTFENTVFVKVNLNASSFSSEANFRGTKFWEPLRAKQCEFRGNVLFERAEFISGRTEFDGSTFKDHVSFDKAIFREHISMREMCVAKGISFAQVKFLGDAIFRRSEFCGDVKFARAHFMGVADFYKVTFRGEANFIRVKFSNTFRLLDAGNMYKVGRTILYGVGIYFADSKFLGKYSFYETYFPDQYEGENDPFKFADVLEVVGDKQLPSGAQWAKFNNNGTVVDRSPHPKLELREVLGFEITDT
ncbi:MAG: hypothetical protein Q4C87_08480 [Actinomycetaceae bacterium]|nr:hypothetical protein [Actinomycetaceae bacterium]